MKNLKIRNRLLSVLLVGTIALSTVGCSVKTADAEKNVTNEPQTTQEQTIEQQTTVGTVDIGPGAERILNTGNGYTLVRYNDHLALVSGDFVKTTNSNPLYSYQEVSAKGFTTTDVNFRLAPVIDKENLIRTLDEGEEINVLGKTDDNWYLVDVNGELGFLYGDYIRILTYDVNSDYELTENTVRVVPAIKARENVRIREQATTESKQLNLLRKDHSIKMIELLPNGWYKVEYKGDVAYVNADFVDETIMVEGDCYKVGYLKNDAYIYDAPNGNVTGTVSQYESGEIYSLEQGYYLIATDDAQVGYIKKEDVGSLTDTAVIIDISAQTLTVYSDNRVVLTAPIVSGRDNIEDRRSDLGIFKINSKEKDRYLTDGSTYNSHVDYWMPYNGGEGLHDASWRSRFGGEIYKTNGSHGCINLPLEKAKELYGIVSVGDNVLVKR